MGLEASPSWLDALACKTTPWPWLGCASVLHLLAVALISWHCLRNRREPASTLLWLFVAWGVPVIGPLLYLAFGLDRVQDKGFRRRVKHEQLLTVRRAREDEALPLAYWRAVREAVACEPPPGMGLDLTRAMHGLLPDHPLLGGNALRALVNGDEAFPAMLEAIRAARHHIHLQSFIFGNDRVGRECVALLHARAREGVQVRVLYDRFGSTFALWGGLFRRHPPHPNFQIAGWTQANPLKRQFQINLRNHRKALIVDGRQAFCGGINLHADNLSTPGAPAIRDYHFEVRGPLVHELQYTFMSDWYFMTDEDPDLLLRADYFPPMPAEGTAMGRVVNSGPSEEPDLLTDVLLMTLTAARRQILAVTPYFVPPREITKALRIAALRGVDVRLIVPARNNHLYAGLAGRALYEELLTAGVQIFQRKPPFMHAKALLVDDTVAVVGTANLDIRSLRLNYETNLVVHDETFVNQLKAIVLEDEALSERLSLAAWQVRPTAHRVVENLCYLLSPIL